MKIDRLLAMTILLLNRGRISAKELADRFEVSTKTIYRDMDTLSQSGIPIFAQQGTSGGFEIMEHYTISRQYLTFAEISSIIAAVKGLNTALDDKTFASLQDKVNALLNKSDKQQTAQHGEGIVFDLNPWAQGPAARHKVNLFKQAIEQTQKVTMSYINMNGTETERVIEPYQLILKGNVWYIQGYCTLRKEFRIFRISRVQQLVLLQDTFERRQTPSLDGYSWESGWIGKTEVDVVMIFQPQVRYRVGDSFHPDQVTILEDGVMRVEGPFALDDWFYGMLLSYGDNVKVEQPEEVVQQIMLRAQNIIRRYQA